MKWRRMIGHLIRTPQLWFILLLSSGLGTGCGYTELRESSMESVISKTERLNLANEKKLDGYLRYVLQLAEHADTSETDLIKLDGIVALQGDDSARIAVVVTLWGMSGANIVKPELISIGARIDSEPQYDIPVFICWIHPLDLRRLIAIDSVREIRPPDYGTTN
jgi:hypothetical protein